jgi:HEPN domain-containing protein
MRYAQSDLSLAKVGPIKGVILESLCFHAQQAVEKSIKAVLKHRGVPFPKIHSIERLVGLLPADVMKASELMLSAILSEFATGARYPFGGEPTTEEEYREAVRLAEAVVEWAKHLIES